MLNWLHVQGKIPDSYHFQRAASYGYNNILDWFYKNYKQIISTIAFEHAAYNGRLNSVQWFFDYYSEKITTSVLYTAFKSALKNKHYHCTDFLYYKFCKYPTTKIEKEIYKDLYEYIPTNIK